MNIEVWTGDNIYLKVSVRRDGKLLDIQSGSTVLATMVHNGIPVFASISGLSTTLGANWSKGIVAFNVPPEKSSLLPIDTVQVVINIDGETWEADENVEVQPKVFA